MSLSEIVSKLHGKLKISMSKGAVVSGSCTWTAGGISEHRVFPAMKVPWYQSSNVTDDIDAGRGSETA